MRDFLRFLFSTADLARIEAGSVTIAEVGAEPAAPMDPQPQALKIAFKVTNPAAGAPQIRPLFPGALTFLVDPADAANLPKPDDAIRPNYGQFPHQGVLRVHLCDADVQKGLAEHGVSLEVLPNAAWYSPLEITEPFLFDTVAGNAGLTRNDVCETKDKAAVAATSPEFPKHAVAGFLRGRYRPKLSLGALATDDDVAKLAMPTVVMTALGDVELTVAFALHARPTDGTSAALDKQAVTNATREHPAHPSNGRIPARHVYRSVKQNLIGAQAGNALVTALFAASPRFASVQFTRSWKTTLNDGTKIADFSLHFPSTEVEVTDSAPAGTKLAELTLPAHGFLFVPITDGSPASGGKVTLRQTDLTWMAGAQPDVWKEKGGTQAVAVNLAANAAPSHVVVRLPMTKAMLIESTPQPGGNRCTYMSLRRSVRALVDNRLAGGRLNHGPSRTSNTTRSLVDEAWSPNVLDHDARARIVERNKPAPGTTSWGPAARRLEKILHAFFSDKVRPAVNVSLPKGKAAYALWQTIPEPMASATLRDDFDDAHVGRGAPASLLSVGLAAGYVFDPNRQAGESDDAVSHRIAEAMKQQLKPGAVLQWWNKLGEYEQLTNREVIQPAGHSPIFLEWIKDATTNEVTHIRVIDQEGKSTHPFTGTAQHQRLKWFGWTPDVWIAANWDE